MWAVGDSTMSDCGYRDTLPGSDCQYLNRVAVDVDDIFQCESLQISRLPLIIINTEPRRSRPKNDSSERRSGVDNPGSSKPGTNSIDQTVDIVKS